MVPRYCQAEGVSQSRNIEWPPAAGTAPVIDDGEVDDRRKLFDDGVVDDRKSRVF